MKCMAAIKLKCHVAHLVDFILHSLFVMSDATCQTSHLEL